MFGLLVAAVQVFDDSVRKFVCSTLCSTFTSFARYWTSVDIVNWVIGGVSSPEWISLYEMTFLKSIYRNRLRDWLRSHLVNLFLSFDGISSNFEVWESLKLRLAKMFSIEISNKETDGFNDEGCSSKVWFDQICSWRKSVSDYKNQKGVVLADESICSELDNVRFKVWKTLSHAFFVSHVSLTENLAVSNFLGKHRSSQVVPEQRHC